MLYQLVKIISRYCINIYYSKLEISGLENIPKDMPLLLAANHPTGFLEPLIIACHLEKSVHFITRGDLFSNKILGPFLRTTNQIPIFRFKDGIAGLRRNQQSIEAAKNALSNGGMLLMFVEGRTEDIKMLKPLQKGMARISTALHQQGLEHRIIPIGVNFVDTVSFRSRVMLNFGMAIDPHPIISKSDDERKIYKDLNEKISTEIKNNMIHVEDRKRLKVADLALDMYQATRTEDFRPKTLYRKDRFDAMKTISEAVNQASESEIAKLDSDLSSIHVAKKNIHTLRKTAFSWWKIFQLIIISPFALLALTANMVPVLFGLYIQKTLVKSREFIAPIRVGASLGVGILWYSIWIAVLCYSFGYLGLFVLLGIPMIYILLYAIFLYRSISKNYGVSQESVARLVSIFTHLK